MSGGGLADFLPGARAKLEAMRSVIREPQDIAALVRPASPNAALAAPEGFRPAPDLVTPICAVAPQRLYAVLKQVGAAQPRTSLDIAFDEALQAHYVVRSAALGFPDLMWVQALPAADGGSRIVLWSRSVLGRYDLGANRARVRRWLSAVDAALPSRKEN